MSLSPMTQIYWTAFLFHARNVCLVGGRGELQLRRRLVRPGMVSRMPLEIIFPCCYVAIDVPFSGMRGAV